LFPAIRPLFCRRLAYRGGLRLRRRRILLLAPQVLLPLHILLLLLLLAP
jgi:hypothetical protein